MVYSRRASRRSRSRPSSRSRKSSPSPPSSSPPPPSSSAICSIFAAMRDSWTVCDEGFLCVLGGSVGVWKDGQCAMRIPVCVGGKCGRVEG
eukprot:361195-Chlamydomonas_euryale.AAC.4